jgi:hypothetical protein
MVPRVSERWEEGGQPNVGTVSRKINTNNALVILQNRTAKRERFVQHAIRNTSGIQTENEEITRMEIICDQ